MEIHTIPQGGCNCYLVKDRGAILVDGGLPNNSRRILTHMNNAGVMAGDLSLILLTHGYWDHIASARSLKMETGCKIAINHHEREWVEKGLPPMPPAVSPWGHVFGFLLKLYLPFVKIPGTPVDVLLDDGDFSLESFGIDGTVIHTPGHSMGSMSLLLKTGEAFVGDSASSGFPVRLGPNLPAFAQDLEKLKTSLRRLIDRGAKILYPAHGSPFRAEDLERVLPKKT